MPGQIFTWEDRMEMGQAVMALGEIPAPPGQALWSTAEEQWEMNPADPGPNFKEGPCPDA